MTYRLRLGSLLGLAAIALCTSVHAAWPQKPITLVVPWPPGGGVDLAARLAGPLLAKELGQQVIVTNKPGATGTIGADSVAKAAPDGYTLLWSSLTSHSIYSSLYGKAVPYDLEKSFVPVSVFASIPLVVVVNPSVKANTLAELISLAKARPGTLTFSSSGNGSVQHLTGEMFMRATGTDMLHVPYKGISPSLLDLAGGQVDASFESLAATLTYIKSGKVRPLAVAAEKRVKLIPDVPTAAEAGLQDFNAKANLFVLAPAGTPAGVVARFAGALSKVLADDTVKEPLLAQSIIAEFHSPEESAKIIHDEREMWAKAIREAGVKPQ